jgi:O-antigen/teichoic acid export membrane protein
MRDLGLYAAAMALAMAPSHALGSIVASVAFPLLSHAQTDLGEFKRRYSLCTGELAVLAGALTVLIVLVGPGLLRLTFGDAYSDAALCLMILGGAQAMRLLRVGTTCGAMALGDNANSMWANAWRVTGLGAALAVAALNAPLHWIAAVGLFGEGLAVAYSILRLRRRHGMRPGTCLRPALATLPAVVAAVLVCGFGFPLGVVGTGLLTMGLLGLCFVLVLLTAPDLRRELGRLLPYRTAPVTMTD